MNDPSATTRPRDYGFLAIVSLLVVITLWLLLTPLVPAIASATMRRFHLGSKSFALWAIQFPIPPMYNFANRYEVDSLPPGMVDPILLTSEKRYINHFPARIVTFADGRYDYLREGSDRWVTIETAYRGQTITTRWHLEAKDPGGFRLNRLAPESAP